MTNYCPHCGGRLSAGDSLEPAAALRRVPHDGGRMGYYPFGEAAAAPGPTWQEWRKPARPPDVAADVATPALQAAVSGLAAGLASIPLVLALDLSWWAAPTAAALTFALTWLYLLRAGRETLWEVERMETAAATETAAPAAPPPPVTRLSVTLEGGRVQHERELGIEPDRLIRLARALAGGRAFSERELTTAGLISGRAQYEELRTVLMAVGWVRWKSAADRRQGLELTAAGRAGVNSLADGRVTVEELAAASRAAA